MWLVSATRPDTERFEGEAVVIHSPDIRAIFVHFGAGTDQPNWSENGQSSDVITEVDTSRMHWYLDWTASEDGSVYALVPDQLAANANGLFDSLKPNHVLRYLDDGDVSVPVPRRRGFVVIVNGNQFPIVQWPKAIAVARRQNADVLAFGPADATTPTHYPESVVVDESGSVIRFKRHYFDSPAFADRWSGEASFLVVKCECAQAVATHIVVRGWGLDSVGSLVRRFDVKWSDDSGIASTDATDFDDGLGVSLIDDANEVFADEIPTMKSSRIRASIRIDEASGSSDWSSTREFAGGNGKSAIGDTTCEGVESSLNSSRRGNEAPVRSSETGSETRIPWDFSPDDLSRMKGDCAYLFCKRTLDILVSGSGLIVLMPLLVAVAILIRLTSRGPIIFAHIRQGLDGREFPCLKFRSMRTGADAMQAQLKALNEVDGPQFKISNDPRLTRFGSWIRRWNIDELPQLFNVLLGHMSLVGPRPSPDRENQYCPAWRRARLSTKPGITGLWQVLRLRDENTSDFQEWIYYDVEYARHRSFWLDLRILFYTLPAIVASQRVNRFAERLERAGICAHSPRIDENRESSTQ